MNYFLNSPSTIQAEISYQQLSIDHDIELILDHRRSAIFDDVPVLAAFGPFAVIYGDPSQAVTMLTAATDDGPLDKYVCRYKIIKLNGKYCLLPWATTNSDGVDLQQHQLTVHNKENTPNKHALNMRTPGKRKKIAAAGPLSVTPIKIVNNVVQKVPQSGRRDYANGDVGSDEGEDDDDADDDGGETTPRKRRRDQQTTNINNNHITKLSACKNLNASLDAGGDHNDLNYSIEQQAELKVKIRISDRSKRTATDRERTPELDAIAAPAVLDTPLRRSRRQTQSQQYGEPPTAESANRLAHLRDQRTPHKSILKTPSRGRNAETPGRRNAETPSRRVADTPKRSVIVTDMVEEKLIHTSRINARRSTRLSSMHTITSSDNDDDDGDEDFRPNTAPRTPAKRKAAMSSKAAATPKKAATTAKPTATPAKASHTPAKLLRNIRDGTITPALQKRTQRLDTAQPQHRSDIQLIKESLHVSAVPQSLPCRETEFHNIESFIERKILDGCGGCMYVSGVPGTGKTATVTEVIRTLQLRVRRRELPDFEYVAINGMKMTEPRQAYVEINRQLTGDKMSCEQAQKALEQRFTRPPKSAANAKTTVLLVDELDILCNRRQDVVYNILDWPTKMAARLVVVTIANTMDLPERLLMGKVTSRLGLTRLTFQPYSHKQLQEVVMARLAGTDMFRVDAVQLVSRKVASVSGDCRRALDICRRSIEIAEAAAAVALGTSVGVLVSMVHVQQAFTEMISSTKVQAIKACSRMEQVFLQGVEAEVARTGVEETSFMGVYTQFESILRLMGMMVPAPGKFCE